jgi:hypothetical protein
VWSRYDGTDTILHSKRYLKGAGWDSMVTIVDSDATVSYTSFVMDKTGNALVVWRQSDGTTFANWYNRYELGDGWSGPQRIEPRNFESNAEYASIAMDDAGNVLAAWIDLGVLRASRYIAGRGWEEAVSVSPEGQTAALPISVSVSSSGVGLATWKVGEEEYWFSRFE